MVNVLYWLLVIEIIGLIALPVAFALLPRLTDRGYLVAKPLGLLLLSWPLWFLGSLHLVPTTPYTLWGTLILFSVASVWYVLRHRGEFAEFIRRERHVILIGEGIFLLMYLAWVLYRAYDPSIDTTEQPMDFAFLNASVMANFFPPDDPWLRGHDVPYYYFGYLMMGNLTELTFIPSRISYNLALALIPALAATAAFGLVYNLIRAHGASSLRAVGFALMAPVLLLLVSNLEGILEFVRLREWGAESFWGWIGIKELGPVEVSSWRPNDYLWWWRGSRVIDSLGPQGNSLDYTITEFPFFSFLLGDMHPHVMSVPFILLFLTFSLNFFLSPALIGARWVREHLGTVLMAALLLGALAFINIWDIVPFGVLWVALMVFKTYRQDPHQMESGWRQVPPRVWLPITATLVLAILMYLPYYISVESQASGILPVGEVGTRPIHFLLIWGLFLAMLLPFLVRQLLRVLSMPFGNPAISCPICGAENTDPARLCTDCGAVLEADRWEFLPRISIVLGLIFLPFFIWVAWQLGLSTLTWSTGPLVVVSERFLNVLPLTLVLFVSLYSLIRYAESGASYVMTFVLALISLALLLILGPEFLRVDDLFHNRMNTIFKVYYQAWILLAVASAFGLYFLSSMNPPSRGILRLAMGGWWGLIGILFVASLYYPVEAVFTKGGQFKGDTTLDGLAYIARGNPGEYAAIRWLQENGKKGEGILEAVGDSWSSFSRISSSTGLPTVLGWPWHEHQWRGTTEPFEGREEEVRTIYTTMDTSEALRLLNKYDIQYVVLGNRERATYGTLGLTKFSQIGDVVFSQESVIVYRVRE
jgi:YYY domain-containing protein